MPDGEARGGLKEHILAALCVAALLLVAFLAAYAGTNLKEPSPGPALPKQEEQTISSAPQEQSQTEKAKADQSAPLINRLPTQAANEISGRDKTGGDQKASGDGWLRVFTGILAFASVVQIFVFRYQGDQLRAAVKVGRDEFVATHRPRIGVRFFQTVSQPDMAVQFTFTNQGETTAIVKAIAARIMQGVAMPIGVIFIDEEVNVRLESGQSDVHCINSTFENPNYPGHISQTSTPIFCIGCIRYSDVSGIMRETGFCRKLHIANDYWFVPDPVPEYEYAY
jgi:hypothetical protein